MDTLRQLGVNQTLWIQLAFFLVSYVFLAKFLFKPYRAAIDYRRKNTGGSVDNAAKLSADTERLAADYQSKIKIQNEQANALYEKMKSEGAAEEDKILSAAKNQAAQVLDKTKAQISSDMAEVKNSLRAQIPQLSALIASRILGRDIQ